MLTYVGRRILAVVPVLFGVTLAVFSMLFLVPGDPVKIMLAEFVTTPEQIARMRAQLHLDEPVLVQYGRFVGNALRGDLGVSIRSRRPVAAEIGENIGSTGQLALASMVVAIGLLAAPVKVDSVRSHFGRLRNIEWKKVNSLYIEMQKSAVQLLTGIGIPERRITLNRAVDMRYVCQGYELTVPLPPGQFNGTSTARVTKAFHDVYAERFGHHLMNAPIEFLSWRLEAVAPTAFQLPTIPVSAKSAKTKPKGERQAFFPEAKKFMRVPVFEHASLPPGARMRGPLVIEQRESTVVVGPKDTVIVDSRGNIVISVNLEK